jgi:MFS family permease
VRCNWPLVVAPAALVFVLANAALGVAIDRLGRKPAILIATSTAALVTAAFGIVVEQRLASVLSARATFVLLCALRLLLGAAAGGFLPAAQACVADLTVPSQRTRGLAAIGIGFALGMVAGLGLAALFSALSPTAPFYAVAALAALATLLVLAVLPEPLQHRHDHSAMGAAQGLGMVAGPLIGSGLYGQDPRAPYTVGLVLLAGAFVLTRRVRRPRPG